MAAMTETTSPAATTATPAPQPRKPAWGKISQQTTTDQGKKSTISFKDVMAEEEMNAMTANPSHKMAGKQPVQASIDIVESDLDPDLKLALELQRQFDLEASHNKDAEEAERERLRKEQEDADFAFALSMSQQDASQGSSTDDEDDEDLQKALEEVPSSFLEDLDQMDFLLASRLQAQFDAEHDASLARYEQVKNGNAKVAVSFSNYRRAPTLNADDFWEDPDLGIVEDDADQYAEDLQGDTIVTIKKKEIITKHDIAISSRRNAKKLESLSLDSGNTIDFKSMRLSNRVYNELREHSRRSTPLSASAQRDAAKFHGKEDVATHQRVLDSRTRLMLFRMINSGQLASLEGIISTGKEANVYGAIATLDESEDQDGSATRDVPAAIKIFKTTLDDFRNRSEYIRDDVRFTNRLSRHNAGKLIKLWAEKEMHNLQRMRRAYIPCPQVIYYKKHILCMTLVGGDRPAPKLKEVAGNLSQAKLESLYKQVLLQMRTMYNDAGLVHADLSEYNILVDEDVPVFIDVSQAVEVVHPRAPVFLYRDCVNIANFFGKRCGIATALSPLETFAFVTGTAVSDGDFAQAQDKAKQMVAETESCQVVPLHVEQALSDLLPTVWPAPDPDAEEQQQKDDLYRSYDDQTAQDAITVFLRQQGSPIKAGSLAK